MKFRNGDRLAKKDPIYPIEIVNKYCYLGITLQITLTFSEHIK